MVKNCGEKEVISKKENKKKMLRVGVIGTGAMGKNHVRVGQHRLKS